MNSTLSSSTSRQIDKRVSGSTIFSESHHHIDPAPLRQPPSPPKVCTNHFLHTSNLQSTHLITATQNRTAGVTILTPSTAHDRILPRSRVAGNLKLDTASHNAIPRDDGARALAERPIRGAWEAIAVCLAFDEREWVLCRGVLRSGEGEGGDEEGEEVEGLHDVVLGGTAFFKTLFEWIVKLGYLIEDGHRLDEQRHELCFISPDSIPLYMSLGLPPGHFRDKFVSIQYLFCHSKQA